MVMKALVALSAGSRIVEIQSVELCDVSGRIIAFACIHCYFTFNPRR